MTISEELAAFVVETSAEDIPDDVRHATGLLLLDSVGTAIGNRRQPFVRALLEVATSGCETGHCTVLGQTEPALGPAAAAEVNSAAIHGSDLDATHIASIIHPSAVAVPVALAAGEAADVTGREAMTAATLGMEVLIRLGLAARGAYHVRGFQPTALLGPVVAAMMATRLDGGGPDRAAEAAGLSTAIAAGLRSFSDDGTWGKRLITGWACRAGIHSSQLVRAGFRGSRDALEKRWGLFPAFLPVDSFDLATITDGLGQQWVLPETEAKRYPCSHGLHPFIEAVRGLRAEIERPDIELVECAVNEEAVRWWFEPAPARYRPDAYAARFSIPYAVARAIVDGDVSDAAFEQAAVGDQATLELADRVRPVIDPSLADRPPVGLPGRVVIHLRSGGRIEATASTDPGDEASFVRDRARSVLSRELGEGAARDLEARLTDAWSDAPISAVLEAARPGDASRQ